MKKENGRNKENGCKKENEYDKENGLKKENGYIKEERYKVFSYLVTLYVGGIIIKVSIT